MDVKGRRDYMVAGNFTPTRALPDQQCCCVLCGWLHTLRLSPGWWHLFFPRQSLAVFRHSAFRVGLGVFLDSPFGDSRSGAELKSHFWLAASPSSANAELLELTVCSQGSQASGNDVSELNENVPIST